jgi:anti-anti-sigma regulatory factor
MNYQLERKEQYALIDLKETSFSDEIPAEFEDLTRTLFREDYHNIILNMNGIRSVDTQGFATIKKTNRLCTNGLGIFVLVSKEDELIDLLEEANIADLELLPTVEEAIDAVFMHALENEFGAGDDDYDDEDYAGGEREEN